jgi:hypothetical protein
VTKARAAFLPFTEWDLKHYLLPQSVYGVKWFHAGFSFQSGCMSMRYFGKEVLEIEMNHVKVHHAFWF